MRPLSAKAGCYNVSDTGHWMQICPLGYRVQLHVINKLAVNHGLCRVIKCNILQTYPSKYQGHCSLKGSMPCFTMPLAYLQY